MYHAASPSISLVCRMPIYVGRFRDPYNQAVVLLMGRIPAPPGMSWGELPINRCRISSINCLIQLGEKLLCNWISGCPHEGNQICKCIHISPRTAPKKSQTNELKTTFFWDSKGINNCLCGPNLKKWCSKLF